MQTHADDQHKFMLELRRRAEESMKNRQSEITTGEPEEKPLASWKSNGLQVVHMPDDKQGILRISIGGGDHLPAVVNYCTIRGKVGQCIGLLERAIAALKDCPE